MDKNAIKKYAVWARTELIERVTQKALQYGISEKNIIDVNADSINGKLLTDVEKKQRRALISKINDKGFEQVMEEVAYTWFNRFAALRFMEVNGYLPSHVRVFTDEDNNFKPQILTEAIHLEIDGLDMDKVYSFKEENKNDELYKYLLIIQCNALNKILPKMFQKISDYSELLLPDNLLREGSVIQQMIEIIPEDDWKDAVQIIGWLYQYYNSVPKDIVFSNLRKNIKFTKEDIPAATQLFTPDWIVRYMVENSLGRLWYEGHPDKSLKSNWKYYLEEVEQESEVQAQLNKIREKYTGIKPEDIKCIDPCMGSGHILVYMFDVLIQIYESYGYSTREAASSIIENNIYGLDIDERAAQLAYFSVMMQARKYDRRFLTRKDENDNPNVPQPHIHVVVDSNNIDNFSLDYFVKGDSRLKVAMHSIISEMTDAKEYGSILNITPVAFNSLYARFEEIHDDISMSREVVLSAILPVVEVADILAQKYDVVVTNPPYLSSDAMGSLLTNYVKKKYPLCKADMFAVFMERCGQMIKNHGYQAMITMHSWMFLSSFEKLREQFVNSQTVINMCHLGARAFEEISGEIVQTVAWISKKGYLDYNATYVRLVDYSSQDKKMEAFLRKENRYVASQKKFTTIPGAPIAYWISGGFQKIFDDGEQITQYVSSRDGLTTGNNELFIKQFWEVPYTHIEFDCKNAADFWASEKKYAPLIKGGLYRKWYGNNWFVITYDKEGYGKLSNCGNKLPSKEIYFLPYITWNRISTRMAFRFCEAGYLFESASLIAFSSNMDDLMYSLAFANSVVAKSEMQLINPTTNMLSGYVDALRIPRQSERERTIILARECIDYAKTDWDSFETSWDFKRHPLITMIPKSSSCFGRGKIYLSECYQLWESECTSRFNQMKVNEEEINRIFIDTYGLNDELISEVEDKDVTVRLAEKKRDIKSLISYAVGCMFGRYSLDVDGLVYAGGDWEVSKYSLYPSDADNIIPICDDEYFEDDIVTRFIKFVETVYGSETLSENLQFIADALGGKGNSKEIIRNYFANDFFADHCKVYQKRPIYWLFDSGKKNGFKCLIYMHRYQPDIIARIRTDYVHEQQSRYRTEIEDLEQRINSSSTSERVKLNKQLKKIKDQEAELKVYEEKIHHLADKMIPINLDDGVKVNYAKFQDVLAKIK